MIYYQRKIITAGTDDRGNKIQFLDNEDGTWTDLYEERIVSEEYVLQAQGAQIVF